MAALGRFSRTNFALVHAIPSPAGTASIITPSVGMTARMLVISLTALGSWFHLKGFDTAARMTLSFVREGALRLDRACIRAPRVGVYDVTK